MTPSRLRAITVNTALCLTSLLLVFVFCEGGLRVYHALFRHRHIVLDEQLGWTPPAHQSYQTSRTAQDGSRYTVHFSTQEHGFRQWGKPDSERLKLLVIGDSFTHALDASDNQTYYARLGEALDAEVFAFGCINYSNWQEFLVLQRHFETLQPDVVIWQWHTNDFINNDFELERQSAINNSGLRRPYLTLEGQEIHRLPAPLPHLRHFANRYSEFMYFLFNRIDRLAARQSSIEHQIIQKGNVHKGFQRSVEITARIFEKAAQLIGDTPVTAFSANDVPPFFIAFQALAKHYGFDFVAEIAKSIRQAHNQGRNVFADDAAHWTPQGHAICAQHLLDHLQTRPSNTPPSEK